jgi:polyferredoxin
MVCWTCPQSPVWLVGLNKEKKRKEKRRKERKKKRKDQQ